MEGFTIRDRIDVPLLFLTFGTELLVKILAYAVDELTDVRFGDRFLSSAGGLVGAVPFFKATKQFSRIVRLMVAFSLRLADLSCPRDYPLVRVTITTQADLDNLAGGLVSLSSWPKTLKMAMVEVDKAALTNRAFRLGLGWFNIEKAIQADVTAAITNALLFSRKDDIGVKNCPHPVIKLFLSIAPNQNNMSAQVPLYLRQGFFGGFGSETEEELYSQGFYRLQGGMVEGLLIHRPHVEKHEPVLAAQLTFTDRTTSTLGHRSIPTARLTSARSLGKRAAETPAISATEGVPDVGSDDDTPMGGFEPADNFFADEEPGASGVIPSADDAQAHAGATLGFETEGDSGAAAGVGGASSGAADDLVQLPGYPCTIQGHALIGHVLDMSAAEYADQVADPASVRSYSCAFPPTSEDAANWRTRAVPDELRVGFHFSLPDGKEKKIIPRVGSDGTTANKRFPHQWAGKWWSVSPEAYEKLTGAEKGNANHVGRIMETSAGVVLQGSKRFYRCIRDGVVECYKYKSTARVKMRSAGDSCARCRFTKKKCTGETRGSLSK
ncbi:hypothetical protein EJ07DRAFT_172316 [Lizonia empirigonia]|nr:hypothetical protein EJ07DRAFT_185017 [Lizonia empirigonia]KAF1364328.1 hypothetical protein EJ07DRAFT_172316 [Lizonia empirigonia]